MEDYKYKFYADDYMGEGMPVTEVAEATGYSILERLGTNIGCVASRPELLLDYLFDKGARRSRPIF
jgi:hypothetical protein